LERDLLIRKLFTAGLDGEEVHVTAWSSTVAILKSILSLRTEMSGSSAPADTGEVIEFPTERLPARSLVNPPKPSVARLSDISAARRTFAA
jgi:cellulose synthase (UDP-forming)